ncbi:Peptide methionine sulfoxide reductase MsrA [Seminavis robusta]|uniref:peptide-methionine (S)-S-oxide reductase n=1 Tax=Seminavis robusta TaxID=568900 RepID=A0A9N8E4B2_9STRA|nr:Peptide methionine sulfoxide reductase MsrA [Seminavis robusta]|eukprot:Sro650_g181430.1 Peptide methionine sulfoxide reductase MsrA (149) ;mRNA; f:42596-43095
MPRQREPTFVLFWGPQRDYDHVDVEGILETVVGYTGSKDEQAHSPTYQNVQDFAEAMRVTFDPSKISYEELLTMMFSFATPADPRFAGTQYRFAIFYHTQEQKALAEKAVEARGRLGSWVAVEPASDFYRAEEYHQKYIDKQTMSMFI